MAQARPSISSDDVDFIVPKLHKENASRIAESLGKNGVIADTGQKSTFKKIQKILR